MVKSYVSKFRFITEQCPYEYHWCNGKHIPNVNPETKQDESSFVDLESCKFLVKGRCEHPNRPRLREG